MQEGQTLRSRPRFRKEEIDESELKPVIEKNLNGKHCLFAIVDVGE